MQSQAALLLNKNCGIMIIIGVSDGWYGHKNKRETSLFGQV
jgi:hypothetical protein